MNINENIKVEIRKDREENGTTLYELVKKYKLSKSSVFEIIRGCDNSNVKKASKTRTVVRKVEAMERPSLSKTDLGEASRQMICARLMLNGVKVFRPMTEDTPIDLLVLKGDGTVVKGQCKYIFPTKRGCHQMPLCSVRKNGANSKAVKHIYTETEVDFFFGYCCDNDTVYVIPFSEAIGRSELHFWILRKCVGSNGKFVFDEQQWRNRFDLLK